MQIFCAMIGLFFLIALNLNPMSLKDPGYQTADELAAAAMASETPAQVDDEPVTPTGDGEPTPTEPTTEPETPAEPETPKVEGEPEEPTGGDEDSFSDDQLLIVRNFKKLSPEERLEKIARMEAGNRPDQLKMVEFLRDTYEVAAPEVPTTPTQEAIANEALEKALEAQGLDKETIAELKLEREQKQQTAAISGWAELVDVDATAVSKNKEFVKAYHRADGSIEERTTAGMKAYLKANPSKSRVKATKTVTTGTKGAATPTAPKKTDGYVNIRDTIGGKNLDEIDV